MQQCIRNIHHIKLHLIPLEHRQLEHYYVSTKGLDASYRPTLCLNVLKSHGLSKRSQTQKEQLGVIDRYSTNLQAVEKPRPKPLALHFESHVTHLEVLSRGRRTLRQTIHITRRMDVPIYLRILNDTDVPWTDVFRFAPFSVIRCGSRHSIHPIPPTHFFRFEVRHCRHSLPAPTSTTAHIPHTLLPQQRHPNSAPLISSSSIPPIDISVSGWSSDASQSSHLRSEAGATIIEFGRQGAEDGIDQ